MSDRQTTESVRDRAQQEFLKESKGWNVDLSGLPSVQERLRKPDDSGEGFIDQRFAPLADDRPLKLRRALTDFANRNVGDTEVATALRDVKNDADGEQGVVYFHVRDGQEVPIDIRVFKGTWYAELNGRRHVTHSRDALLSGISRELNGHVRALTDAEKREVSIVANGRGFYAGLAKYAALKTGAHESEVLSDVFLLDDRHAKIMDEAIAFVWLAVHGDFAPGQDWSEFLAAYASGRNYTVALLDGCRAAYEKARDGAARERILNTIPIETSPQSGPGYQDLDELEGDALDKLYHGTLRAYSKQVRGGAIQ